MRDLVEASGCLGCAYCVGIAACRLGEGPFPAEAWAVRESLTQVLGEGSSPPPKGEGEGARGEGS